METIGNKNIQSQFLGKHPIVRTYKGDELINEYKPLYNPPSDWKDIRTDCPENSIALYAAHSRINNTNYNIEKVTGPVKYTVVGNPTINNGIVSGFSSSNYLNISKALQQTENIEFNVKFHLEPSSTIRPFLKAEAQYQQFGIRANGQLVCSLGFHDGAWRSIESQYIFSDNTTYTVNLKINNMQYTLKVYDSSAQLLTTETGSATYPYNATSYLLLGAGADGSYFTGSIDLNETYIKVNNQMWFGSQMQLTSANENLYLQSSGTQYIDTGVIADNETGMLIKASVCSNNYTDNIFVGSRKDSGDSRFSLDFDWSAGGKITVGYNRYYTTSFSSLGLSEGQDCVATLNFKNDRTAKVNDILCKDLGNITLTQQTSSVYMFKLNYSSSFPYTGKIYYLQISQGSNIIQHLVPVPQGLVIGNFTVPSNGMFDIVEQKFYGNLGTGDFTYGNDSPETITYDNLGFTATCTGGYKVFIDGNQYGGIRTSGSQCNIIWSQSGITTGDDITTPSALKAHKIWIEPATEGNNITVFRCRRVAASGIEHQGILWEHFNITNTINISSLNAVGNYGSQDYKNTLLTACTAKNNLLKVSGDLYCSFFLCGELEYLPVIDGNNTKVDLGYFGFAECNTIKKIDIRNLTFEDGSYAFSSCTSLEELPKRINYASAKYMSNYLTNANSLKNAIFDVSSATGLKAIGCFNIANLKGLRVSNQAPFDSWSPQIDIRNTGMERQALVQLFNDLPTVSSGQIINITGCTGVADLTADDRAIATNKGWTITE